MLKKRSLLGCANIPGIYIFSQTWLVLVVFSIMSGINHIILSLPLNYKWPETILKEQLGIKYSPLNNKFIGGLLWLQRNIQTPLRLFLLHGVLMPPSTYPYQVFTNHLHQGQYIFCQNVWEGQSVRAIILGKYPHKIQLKFFRFSEVYNTAWFELSGCKLYARMSSDNQRFV